MEQGLTGAEISYHVWWPSLGGRSDPWYRADSVDVQIRVGYYGTDAIPRVDIDGSMLPGWSLDGLRDSLIARVAMPSRVWMSIRSWANAADDSLFMQVKVVADSVVGSGAKLHMAVTEIYTHWDTPAPNGQQDFYAALLRMFPNAHGQDITHSGNPADTLTFTGGFAIPQGGPIEWLPDNLRMLAWVQQSASRDVLQAATYDFPPLFAPQAADTMYVGVPTTVRWSPRVFNGSVTLQIQRDYPHGQWETLLENALNTGSFEWNVTAPVSDRVRMRLFAVADPAQCDTTAGDFCIATPAALALSPDSLIVQIAAGDTMTRVVSVTNISGTDARIALITNTRWAWPLERNFAIPAGSEYLLRVFFDGSLFSADTVVSDTWLLTGNLIPQEFALTMSILRSPISPRGTNLQCALGAVYPNPFNATARIQLDLSRPEYVTLQVFDVTGRQVAVLINGVKPAGSHDIVINGGGLPSGVYFARLNAGEFAATRKLLLLR